MRISFCICICLILALSAQGAAQDFVPPPGFSPGQDEDLTPAPAPRSRTGPATDYPPQLPPARGSWFPDSSPLPASEPPLGPVLLTPDVAPIPRVWLRAEALYWWTKSSPLPIPIVTQGSLADSIPGAIGQPGTSVLIGNQDVDFSGRGGGRFTLGFALDDAQTWGFEGSYFFLGTASVTQGVFSDGGPGSALLAFPFINANSAAEDSTLIASPGFFAGTARLTVTDFLQGFDANLLYNINNSGGVRFDLLGGFRYLNLQENLSFVTDSPNVFPNPPAFFHTFDQFNASNNFYGGQIGGRISYDNTRIFMNATGKLALGSTFEMLSVNGGTTTNAGGFASAPGAYLSQPTNLGSQTVSQFAIIPEMNLNFGIRLNPWASFMVGYSFLYVSSVARPGDQLDRVINTTQAPAITGNFPGSLAGPARPALNIRDTDFWAQGLNFGLEFRY